MAIVLVEDDVEVDTTLRHHLAPGFREMVLDHARRLSSWRPWIFGAGPHRIDFDRLQGGARDRTREPASSRPRRALWMYYCYNAEYLFYPFCETRTVGEMLAFHAEERRDAMLSYVVDLYAGDLQPVPGRGLSGRPRMLDRSGYYALARQGRGEPRPPQGAAADFFGGLRWRYEEHVPPGAAQDRPRSRSSVPSRG